MQKIEGYMLWNIPSIYCEYVLLLLVNKELIGCESDRKYRQDNQTECREEKGGVGGVTRRDRGSKNAGGQVKPQAMCWHIDE